MTDIQSFSWKTKFCLKKLDLCLIIFCVESSESSIFGCTISFRTPCRTFCIKMVIKLLLFYLNNCVELRCFAASNVVKNSIFCAREKNGAIFFNNIYTRFMKEKTRRSAINVINKCEGQCNAIRVPILRDN